MATHDERPKHGDRKCQHKKQCKHQVRGMRAARRDEIDIRSYTEPGNQAQTIRMIIEHQNASYRFAAKIGWWCDDGEKRSPLSSGNCSFS
jgi:hypothetical protein